MWDIMSVVSTGLDLSCPAALCTMLCSLIARVSAFHPSDTKWKNCWSNLLPLKKKIPTNWKQAFIVLGNGLSPNWRQVIAWNNDDPVVDTGLLLHGHNKLATQLQLEMPLVYFTNKPNIIAWWSYPACFSPQCLITRTMDVVGEQWKQGVYLMWYHC